MKKLILLLSFISAIVACARFSKPENSANQLTASLITDWSQLSDGYELGQPPSIDIDQKQNMIIFQRAHENSGLSENGLIQEDVILILNLSIGKIISSFGANHFIKPHGLSVDSDNNIWVTDVELQQVFKFNHDGKLLLTLGEKNVAGNDALHFDQPTDAIASTDGFIYVTDGYGNNRVVKLSPEGKYITEWGREGHNNGEFNLPHALDIDRFGNLYVADRENNRIQMFKKDGSWVKTWSDPSFSSVQSLKIDNDGNTLYIVDYRLTEDGKPKGSNIIKINTKSGEFERLVNSEDLDKSPSRYHDIVLDSVGNVYVADIIKNTVHKFSVE